MSIYKRENGIYYYRVKKNGKDIRISLETKDKELAYRIYEKYMINKFESKILELTNPTPKDLKDEKSKRVSKTPKEKQSKSISKAYSEYKDLCMTQKTLLKVSCNQKSV